VTEGQTRWLVIATHVGHDGSGGGMVRYAVEMVRALGEVGSVEPHVLTRRAGAPFFAELLGSEQRVHVVPNAPTMAIAALECTGVAIPSLRRGFDVVHGTKHFVPRFGSAHRVLTVHDMLLLDRPRDYSALKRVVVKRPYLSSIAHAESLICVSEATRERLRAFTPRAAARSDVVRSAVSTSLVDAEPRAVARLEGRRFALVVGDPSPRKNLRLLVDNWRRVTDQVPDAVLAIAGPDGWGLADLGDAYASLVASGQVVALGHVPDDQLRWCYEQAVVVLCPSLHEGFGLPAIEALTFASALITSDDPALREVSDGRALHVPVEDPAGWIAAIAARFAGRQQAPEHSYRPRRWRDVAIETVDRVLARRRAAPRPA
jgi:glycosyltransferase involved in cell wall biosynthesis